MFSLSRRMIIAAIVSLTSQSRSDSHAGKNRRSSKNKPQVTSDILHGTVSDVRNYPYAVGITDNDGSLCGGFLIDRQSVITADHCRLLMDLSTTEINLGRNSLNSSEGLVVHPAYFRTVEGDVAYIRLREPVDTRRYRPIALPESSDAFFTQAGQALTAMGWGITEAGTSGTFRTVTVTVHSDHAAKKAYALGAKRMKKGKGKRKKKKIRSTFNPLLEYAAGGVREGAPCNGDSGSTQVGERSDGTPVAVGVTSYGSVPCGVKFGINADLLPLVPKIRQLMAE